MYDLTTIQLHHRIDEYHRMRRRVEESDTTTVPTRRNGVRTVVAAALLSLAARLAPPASERPVTSRPTSAMQG